MSKKRNRDDFGPRVHDTGYVRTTQSRNYYLGDNDPVFPARHPKFDRHYHNKAHHADELKYRKMFIYYHYVYILGGKAPEKWTEQGTIELVLTALGLHSTSFHIQQIEKILHMCYECITTGKDFNDQCSVHYGREVPMINIDTPEGDILIGVLEKGSSAK